MTTSEALPLGVECLRFISATLAEAGSDLGDRLEVAMALDAPLVTLRLAGFTHPECARMLGCSKGQVRRREANVMAALLAQRRREGRRITATLFRRGQLPSGPR